MSTQPDFIPVPEQIVIFDNIKTGTGHSVVNAVAGSGKSTTIVRGINVIPNRTSRKIAIIVYNKHIRDALKDKLPKSVTVATSHSLGLNCINRMCYDRHNRIAEVDASAKVLRGRIEKYAFDNYWFGASKDGQPLTWAAMEKEEERRNADYLRLLNELMDKCYAELAVKRDDIARVALKYDYVEFTGNDFARLEGLFSFLYFDNPLHLLYVSFNEMVFLPAMGLVPVHTYDYLFVDEAQDLSRGQQMLTQRALKPNGRRFAVGDPYQAIYSFAGADSESFQWFVDQATNNLPLSCCFRCGSRIIELAQTIVPHIRAFPGAPAGVVRYGSYREAESGDYVLCRFNAPLIGLTFRYIRDKKKANMKGTDIGKQLLNLIEDYKKFSLEQLTLQLDRDLSTLRDKLIASGMKPEEAELSGRYQSMLEKVLTIQAIAEQVKSTEKLIRGIEYIFADDIEGITLSSVHRSKGLEARRVYILLDDLMPAFQAKTPEQIKQEWNLIYVAYTRAKAELIFINDFTEVKVYDEKSLTRSKRLNAFLGIPEPADEPLPNTASIWE
jgi:superfamily I DNA/RNA helicase